MNDKFLITPDYKSRMLRVALKGFWDETVARQYEAELAPIYAKIGNGFDLLVDLREFDIQTANIVGGFARIGHGPRKMAIITPSALLKRQAERATVAVNSKVFTDEASAMEWLALKSAAESE